MSANALVVDGLRHQYGDRTALDGISFSVARGELFGLLGPNGSGKTTLFKLLSTLVRPSGGTARVGGHDLAAEPDAVRRLLGVVFQRPSVDGKLTVRENLLHHGHLYGLHGADLAARVAAMSERLAIADRLRDRVETLSGGLQRRVELAKGLLHQPRLLLLDEPTTGLDPAARRDFMRTLLELRARDGVTVVLTTHYLEEAERCDRVAIMHAGQLLTVGEPDALKARVGGDVVVVQAVDAAALQGRVRERFGVDMALVDGTLRAERPRGHEFLAALVDAFPGEVRTVTFGKPTLEDVFIQLTGERFWAATAEAA
ncbi:MAG: ABC transporter ATP-binding protein [Deltaproteobacteria bacterium]|nr:ABC transporter ATP-binding protein [Deltaproteobacteria bacterium]